MDKFKKSLSLAVVACGTVGFSQASLAQYYVPMQPPVPRHDTMFPRRDRPVVQENNFSPAPRYRSSDSPRGSFDKAACEAGINRQLQAQPIDMNEAMADLAAFNRRMQLMIESIPACRR
jgi:hypothetical protein